MNLMKTASRLSLGVAIVALAGASYIFFQVQVLTSYPFYGGVYGTQDFLTGVSYTVALEFFGFLAVLGLFVWSYLGSAGGRRSRVLKGAATVAVILGSVIATIVYVETRLVWGEVLPGVHLWQGLQGGGGYPWGTEQVAYNTCLIQSSVKGDCAFLNYTELLLLALVSAVLGYIILSRTRVPSGSQA